MATFERPKSKEKLPADLIPVIRNSGILSDRQLAEIKSKVLRGEYPLDPIALAGQLVRAATEAGVDEMLWPLLATFAEDAPARFAALERGVKSGDAKAIQTAAHAFKSGAGR